MLSLTLQTITRAFLESLMTTLKIHYTRDSATEFVLHAAKLDDSGADLTILEDVYIPTNNPILINTGVALGIPKGYEVQIRPRSSSLKNGIHVALGTVDRGYSGELKICAVSVRRHGINLKRGDKIAQIVLCPVVAASDITYEVVEHLEQTERGAGGFGSTDVK